MGVGKPLHFWEWMVRFSSERLDEASSWQIHLETLVVSRLKALGLGSIGNGLERSRVLARAGLQRVVGSYGSWAAGREQI